MRTCKILGLFVLMWVARPSLADSDGAFCIGPDYLAFQLSVSVNDGNHRLYVMRFDDPKEWKNLSFVDLPYFSSPTMRCESAAIYLSTNTVHVISWDSSAPRVLRHRTMLRTLESEAEGYPDTLGSLSLGMPGSHSARTFSLPTTDSDHTYELQVEKVPAPENECIRNVRSWVSQKSRGQVVGTHELVATSLNAECGE